MSTAGPLYFVRISNHFNRKSSFGFFIEEHLHDAVVKIPETSSHLPVEGIQ